MLFAVAIVSVFFGTIFSYILHHLIKMREMDIEVLNDHISQISKIEDLATEYWLSQSNDTEELGALAARINGAFTATSYFRKEAERLLGSRFEPYVTLDGNLYDLATGGLFQSTGREPDQSRAVKIITVCNELRSLLRQGRRALFWAR